MSFSKCPICKKEFNYCNHSFKEASERIQADNVAQHLKLDRRIRQIVKEEIEKYKKHGVIK